MKSNLVEFQVVLFHETERGVLVDFGGKAPVWLPRSLVEIEPGGDGKPQTAILPDWLAQEKHMV